VKHPVIKRGKNRLIFLNHFGPAVISLSSAWQHPSLTKSRQQVEHQQLAEMRGRSVLQRLRAVFVAD